jgi:hypothetical protein
MLYIEVNKKQGSWMNPAERKLIGFDPYNLNWIMPAEGI